jgi:hypothetical protein
LSRLIPLGHFQSRIFCVIEARTKSFQPLIILDLISLLLYRLRSYVQHFPIDIQVPLSHDFWME